jgi:hypothetical protein
LHAPPAAQADRACGRGFDAGAVADALSSFIAAGGDMMALRPAGRCVCTHDAHRFAQKHTSPGADACVFVCASLPRFELKVTSALAALHGLRCTVQGSAKKRFAVLHMTRHASAPMPDDPHLLALLRTPGGGGGGGGSGGHGDEDSGRKRSRVGGAGAASRRRETRDSGGRGGGGGGSGGGGSGPRRKDKTPRSGGAASAPRSRMAFISGGRIGGEEDGEMRAAVSAPSPGVALEASFAAVRSGVDAVPIAFAASTSAPAAPANRGLRRAGEAAAREAAKLARRRHSRGPPEDRGRGGGGGGDASMRSHHHAPHGDFAGFEQYTTGFGSRIMAKMGFAGAGAGLGATGQGRAEPVLPSMRGRGIGLGAE